MPRRALEPVSDRGDIGPSAGIDEAGQLVRNLLNAPSEGRHDLGCCLSAKRLGMAAKNAFVDRAVFGGMLGSASGIPDGIG